MSLLEIGYRDTGANASRPPLAVFGTPGVEHFVRIDLENDEAAKADVGSRSPEELRSVEQAAGHIIAESEHIQTPADAA